MIEEGVTILLVSHDISMIERLCNKTLWLDHGEMKALGQTNEICDIYINIG